MTDYAKKLVAMLTNAYTREDVRRESPTTVVGKIFYTLATFFADSIDSVNTIKEWRNLDYAEGAFLDKYGANYGVKRQGATDEFYRLMIKVKMLAQLSGGDTNTIINATATLYSIDPEKIVYEEIYPAKIKLFIKREDLNEGYEEVQALINKLVNRIIAAGVGYEIYHTIPVDLQHNTYYGAALVTKYGFKVISEYNNSMRDLQFTHASHYVADLVSKYRYLEILEIKESE